MILQAIDVKLECSYIWQFHLNMKILATISIYIIYPYVPYSTYKIVWTRLNNVWG